MEKARVASLAWTELNFTYVPGHETRFIGIYDNVLWLCKPSKAMLLPILWHKLFLLYAQSFRTHPPTAQFYQPSTSASTISVTTHSYELLWCFQCFFLGFNRDTGPRLISNSLKKVQFTAIEHRDLRRQVHLFEQSELIPSLSLRFSSKGGIIQ